MNRELVVDNDGRHRKQAKSGTVELTQGWHDILVAYFEAGNSGPSLAVTVLPPCGIPVALGGPPTLLSSAMTRSSELHHVSCTACRPGQYDHDKDATSQCVTCDSGTSSVAGSTACEECEPGSYSNKDTHFLCLHCPNGTFSEDYGAEQCDTCERGNEVGLAATSCDSCQKGRYSNEPVVHCRLCPAGRYGPTVGATYTPGYCNGTEFGDDVVLCTDHDVCTEMECSQFRERLDSPWSKFVSGQQQSASGVTCSAHGGDNKWPGGCSNLINGKPGFSSETKQGFPLKQNGYVDVIFPRPRWVQQVT